MRFKRILAATDFSAGAQSALRVAARLACAADAELVIAHAWEIPTSPGMVLPAPAELETELREDAVRGLDDASQLARGLGATRVSSTLLRGATADAIVDASGAGSFDLVVVGTHGRGALARVLVGSVAAKIVRHAPCSVLVVRPDSAATPFTHVLCPIDFSESAEEALRIAAELAAVDHARLTLLNVQALPLYAGPRTVEYVQVLQRSARELLDKTLLRARETLPGATARAAIGSPGGQTIALVDEDPTIDLVVMGSHGRTGIKRMLFGSVAEKVMRHARCPVLVARGRAS